MKRSRNSRDERRMTCGVAVTTYQATGFALDLDIFSFDDVLPL